MLVFLDESGDTGLKLEQGSSKYFIVGIVLFNDHEEANKCDQRITFLKKELGFNESFEFHFKENSNRVRKAFFEAIRTYDFFYFAIVINKANLYGPGFNFKESFYKYTCSLVFENAKPHLDNAIVVLDGSGGKEFRKQLARYLKTKVNISSQRYIKKVKPVRSSVSNNLVQLADMVTSAINRSLSDKKDSQTFRDLIKHREIYVQTWPK